MQIHFKQIHQRPTHTIKEFVCIKCDYVTTGEELVKQAQETKQRVVCPECKLELVGRMDDADPK